MAAIIGQKAGNLWRSSWQQENEHMNKEVNKIRKKWTKLINYFFCCWTESEQFVRIIEENEQTNKKIKKRENSPRFFGRVVQNLSVHMSDRTASCSPLVDGIDMFWHALRTKIAMVVLVVDKEGGREELSHIKTDCPSLLKWWNATVDVWVPGCKTLFT